MEQGRFSIRPQEASLYAEVKERGTPAEKVRATLEVNHRKTRKQELRQSLRAVRDALTPAEREAKSAAIAARLQAEPSCQSAHTLMFFVSMRSEVCTEPAIRSALSPQGRVVVPRTYWSERRLEASELRDFDADLAAGTFGVPEPKPECYRPVAPYAIDLVILPGLAFDVQGGRTGYGGGLYDRFLKRVPRIVPRIALAYELQVVEEVPMKPYDQRVDLILTEDRRIDCHTR